MADNKKTDTPKWWWYSSWIRWQADYYLAIADTIRKNRIRCHSRQIGGVLVKGDYIIATGFNGPPRGIPECCNWEGNWGAENQKPNECPRRVMGLPSGTGLEYCPAVHCERNMLLACARMGISSKGSVMYMTCGLPCKDCMIEIIQAGVSVIVCNDFSIYDELSWKVANRSTLEVLAYKENKWYILNEKEWVLYE